MKLQELFEEKLTFTVHQINVHNVHGGELWIHVMSDRGEKLSHDQYQGINVIFNHDGSIEWDADDPLSNREWIQHGHEIISVAKKFMKFDNKDEFLKKVLRALKDGDTEFASILITIARKYGYNYPEFTAIEKSLGDK